ncbi:MAG: primosomal protein N', partial [Alphaproteobacteria bacterium]
PPFGRLASLIVSGRDPGATERAARMLARIAPQYRHARVLGPAPAPLAQLRGRWRWRLLLQAGRDVSVQAILAAWLQDVKLKDGVRLAVDVDPYNFM